VHYQPVVELETGRPVGVEALVRWEHPDRGLLLPADFVALAEETGLIVRLGQQVLGRACRDVARWQERFGAQLTLAVNVSGRQLADPDFTAQAASAAGSLGPGTLRLEVTETVLIGEGEAAVPVLADLHIHGISVVLDDFGTGYSSLAYLKRFNVDALKIDQVFVADMVRHEGDRAIVDAVLRMADSLGIDVVAEGIETAQQAEALQELGCRAGQGFHFSRPLDAESLERYLEQMLQPA
jgi:EAL domain-containing protein (putative c-di-GMP-specific phosphodiesterase class I)